MSGGEILQTPTKTYPSPDGGNLSCCRLLGSVKNFVYCKNLLKNSNGEMHTVVKAVCGRSLTHL